MLLLAHHQPGYRALGRLVARAGAEPLEPLLDEYEAGLMGVLRRVASRRRHVNVMHHLMGFLKNDLDAEDKRELLAAIEEYRQSWVPLATPLALLHHHLRKVQHAWVEAQTYLDPYPRSLALRSQI
jgi:uncharacterized protein YbgA (DUF1722 family)